MISLEGVIMPKRFKRRVQITGENKLDAQDGKYSQLK